MRSRLCRFPGRLTWVGLELPSWCLVIALVVIVIAIAIERLQVNAVFDCLSQLTFEEHTGPKYFNRRVSRLVLAVVTVHW